APAGGTGTAVASLPGMGAVWAHTKELGIGAGSAVMFLIVSFVVRRKHQWRGLTVAERTQVVEDTGEQDAGRGRAGGRRGRGGGDIAPACGGCGGAVEAGVGVDGDCIERNAGCGGGGVSSGGVRWGERPSPQPPRGVPGEGKRD